MIRRQDLIEHIDHLKLLYNKPPSQCMMKWRLLLEEHYPKVVHVAGVDNDVVDALSRLDLTDKADDLTT